MSTILDLLTSKKFISALIGAIVAFIAAYLDMPTEQVAIIVAPFVAHILGQGVADIGKEKEIFGQVMINVPE